MLYSFFVAEAFPTLIERARLGDLSARDAVYRLAYLRLRSIASALLRRERAGHTLQPTALVSEVFLKLHKFAKSIASEDHFFRLAARAMQQVLIDHARTRKPVHVISPELIGRLLPTAHNGFDRPNSILYESLMDIKQVFEKLRKMDSLVAETVWLRSVEELTVDELSRRQKREPWRVRADCDFGLRWMANRLNHYV